MYILLDIYLNNFLFLHRWYVDQIVGLGEEVVM